MCEDVQWDTTTNLMKLDEAQLQEGLQWSRSNYGKLDVERLIELAIELHQDAKKAT